MDERRLAQLEAQIEQFIEGVFVGLWRRPPNAHEIALQLARAFQQHVRAVEAQLVAADVYIVSLHPQAYERLERQWEALRAALSAYLEVLAEQAQARFVQPVQLFLERAEALERNAVLIQARHSAQAWPSTQAMQAVSDPGDVPPPRQAWLLINGQRSIPLSRALVNVGRADHNDIILDDPHVSRHHAQIRLRWGSYTLFDAESASGTFVNDVRVREHRLQNGDTIRLGHSLLLYLADEAGDSLGSTAHFEPVE